MKDADANLKLRNRIGLMPWTVAKNKGNQVLMKMLTEQSNIKKDGQENKNKLPQI